MINPLYQVMKIETRDLRAKQGGRLYHFYDGL